MANRNKQYLLVQLLIGQNQDWKKLVQMQKYKLLTCQKGRGYENGIAEYSVLKILVAMNSRHHMFQILLISVVWNSLVDFDNCLLSKNNFLQYRL
jgi:hypothetical protein